MMNFSKERKLKTYAIGSIMLGLLQFGSYLFEKLFIWICFPGKYKGEGFIAFSFLLLIIAGIFIFRKRNGSIPLYRIFSIILLIDSIIRQLFFLDEFPQAIIIIEVLIGLIFLKISFDSDLEFKEEMKKKKN